MSNWRSTKISTIVPQIPSLPIMSDSDVFEINSQGFINNKNDQITVDNSSLLFQVINFDSQNIEIKEMDAYYSSSPLYFIP